MNGGKKGEKIFHRKVENGHPLRCPPAASNQLSKRHQKPQISRCSIRQIIVTSDLKDRFMPSPVSHYRSVLMLIKLMSQQWGTGGSPAKLALNQSVFVKFRDLGFRMLWKLSYSQVSRYIDPPFPHSRRKMLHKSR